MFDNIYLLMEVYCPSEIKTGHNCKYFTLFKVACLKMLRFLTYCRRDMLGESGPMMMMMEQHQWQHTLKLRMKRKRQGEGDSREYKKWQ